MPYLDTATQRYIRESTLSSEDKASQHLPPPAHSDLTKASSNASEDNLAKLVEIAERRRGQLLCVARRIAECREDAEDIVQYALLKAFANLSAFRGDSQMSTWLYIIVQNTARQWLRDRKGRVCLSLDYGGKNDEEPMSFNLPDTRRNPEEAYQQSEMENIVRSELEQLNSVCTRAIQLCFLDELSQRAAARAQDVNLVTIKSRVFRGKQMLKRAICKRTGNQLWNVNFERVGSNTQNSALSSTNELASSD